MNEKKNTNYGNLQNITTYWNEMKKLESEKHTVLRGWPISQSVAALNSQVLTGAPALAIEEYENV